MKKEELLKILKDNNGSDDVGGDKELMHITCDNALLKYINDEEITNAFDDKEGVKWYA